MGSLDKIDCFSFFRAVGTQDNIDSKTSYVPTARELEDIGLNPLLPTFRTYGTLETYPNYALIP